MRGRTAAGLSALRHFSQAGSGQEVGDEIAPALDHLQDFDWSQPPLRRRGIPSRAPRCQPHPVVNLLLDRGRIDTRLPELLVERRRTIDLLANRELAAARIAP